jgi:hypothetical protein
MLIFSGCAKVRIMKETYGREQLTLAPQHDANVLGILYSKVDKKKGDTMTEAGERYYHAGGKLSF